MAQTQNLINKEHRVKDISNDTIDNLISLQSLDDEISLREILAILRRRALTIISVASLAMVGCVGYLLTAEKTYQGNFQILVEPLTNDRPNLLSLTDNLPSSSGVNGLDYGSQIKVLKSSEMINQVLPKLKVAYPNLTYKILSKNLDIERLQQEKILKISYKSPDATQINTILSKLSDFYLKYSLERRKTTLNQGLQFIDNQLPVVERRVNNLQIQLQRFRQKYQFVNPDEQSTSVVAQIQDLEKQRVAVEQRLGTTRLSYSTLLTAEGQEAILNQAPIYSGLITQLRQLEAQLSAELARFQSDNPLIETLQEKIQNLLPLIENEKNRFVGLRLAEVANEIKLLEEQNSQLLKAEQQYRARFQLLPILAKQHTDLQRKLQLANESLNRFLEAREKLAIEVAQTEIPWELIQSPTTSKDPISPKLYETLLIGLLASISTGIVFGLILEKLDNSYHDPTLLQEKTKLPLLGTVPMIKNIGASYQSRHDADNNKTETLAKVPLKVPLFDISNLLSPKKKRRKGYGYGYGYYGEGHFWQSLQVLYANIELLNSDQIVKSIAISSSVKGEGKSTMSIHLAQIAASVGKKVLLVDSDLRLPQIHKRLDLPNIMGLTNAITSNIPVEEVIQRVPDLDMLSVITSGILPPDPMRLLSSEKMKQMMRHFREEYDLVIYDCPPISGLVDTRLLASQVDGLLLVVKMHNTDIDIIKQVQESLRQSSISILGVVANQYKRSSHQNYDYYYSYYSYRASQSAN
ncbi:GumC family protein [Cylindrospermopsis raciborskii]|uniref:GumC family protein n=1 Tax=Cylindrospermopsis raciborskii TaxID=77022 RepID=UPI0008DCB76D|nr:polysaccharide biosynthesis tyrosine autokinase [Cylindrospermopsis raciborskii]NLQ06193.1 polysaccharide biosynthesis tyrosine autokinase [Cylindrospermopsis raciborskii MVCC19]OHY34815.1 capsular biosynthesis protein [Cylindrospermopsis raciborskii MVCC14]